MLKLVSYSPTDDPTMWYRVRWPWQSLAEKGLAVFENHFGEDTSISLDGPAVVLFQRTGLTHLPLMKKFKENGVRVVYDIDDDLPHLPESNPANLIVSPSREVAARHHLALLNSPRMDLVLKDFAPFLKLKTVNVAEMAVRNFNAIIQSMKIADLVTVSTPSLKRTYSGWNVGKIAVLPNEEKQGEWTGIVRAPLLSRIVIGWSGGVTHYFEDLPPIQDAVARIMKENPTVHLHSLGIAEAGELFKSCPKERTFTEAWASWEEHKNRVAEMDIVLAPSFSNPKFGRGKSDIRILQGFMMGIPCVGSELTYGQTIRESGGGFVANTSKEWYESISKLVKDSDLRRELGANGKQYMESRVYETNTSMWMDTYQALLK